MRTFISAVIIAILSCSCSSKNEIVKPESGPVYHTYPGTASSNDNSAILSFDDQLVLCGRYKDSVLMFKISKSGEQVWRHVIYGGYHSYATALAEGPGHDLYLCGSSWRTPDWAVSNVLLIRTGQSGDTLWKRSYNWPDDAFGEQIISTADGNILVGGKTFRNVYNIILLKVKPNGDTLWTRTFNSPATQLSYHLLENRNGEYLITGAHSYGSFDRSLFYLMLDRNGNKLWEKMIGDSTWQWGGSTVELANGDLVTCGAKKSKLLLIKSNMYGDAIWEREYGGDYLSEEGYSIQEDDGGNLTIACCNVETQSLQNIMVLKVDMNGNQLWLKRFGGPAQDWGLNLIQDMNGNNFVTGTTYSFGPNASNGNIFMTRLDKNGNYN